MIVDNPPPPKDSFAPHTSSSSFNQAKAMLYFTRDFTDISGVSFLFTRSCLLLPTFMSTYFFLHNIRYPILVLHNFAFGVRTIAAVGGGLALLPASRWPAATIERVTVAVLFFYYPLPSHHHIGIEISPHLQQVHT